MKQGKRFGAFLSALLLAASLCACTIPTPGFAEYDVSAYIQALLDSSYHDSNDGLISVAKITEEKARENNTATVENAAVTFCNTYGLAPSDGQLDKLKAIMKQAFLLTKYTVKDERKVEGGYYLEVEVASITNFEDREEDIAKLKLQAQQELSGGETPAEEDPSSAPVSPGPLTAEANTLFIDKVLGFCERELANVSYDPEMRSIPLDIRQTDAGELQLDLNQIDAIDKLAVRF